MEFIDIFCRKTIPAYNLCGPMEQIRIFRSFVNIRSVQDYVECIAKSLTGGAPATFFYLNTYSSYLCRANDTFNRAFNSADFIIPDGISIVVAIRLLYGIRIRKVTANHTFFDVLARRFDTNGTSLFLFGSTPQILDKAAANLRRSHPGIVLAGTHHGYLANENETEAVIAQIRNSSPDVLFVGMGMPRSEEWIAKNKHRINARCIMTVGNLIDLIAEEQKIAPRWIVDSGFEWFYRFIREPARLGPRYLKANSRYLFDLASALLRRALR